jgi:hypothetical protein
MVRASVLRILDTSTGQGECLWEALLPELEFLDSLVRHGADHGCPLLHNPVHNL